MKFRYIFCAVLCLSLVSAQDIYLSTSDSIQAAFDKAKPGDTIHLADGKYAESFETVRDGTRENPIILEGSQKAVVTGDGNGRLIQVFHDNIHFKGFTIDGLNGNSNDKNAYTDKLVYVQGKGIRDGVEGFKMLHMTIKNSGGEAVRLRYFITNAEIAHNTFLNTGMHDFKFGDGGKNGESIYLGTSSNQWGDGKNPTSDPDESTGNWIHHNYFDTQGNECVDIKEGAHDNIVEYNVCTGQKDPNSGGLDSRGDANIFRYNEVYGCAGAGIRLGGHNIDGHQYGQGNQVYGNTIYDNKYGAIKTMVASQGSICGNDCAGNGAEFGSYDVDPIQVCSITTKDTTPTARPTPIPEPKSTPEPTPTPKPTPQPIDLAGTGVESVISSSHDGNVCPNTLDGDLNSRWSARGHGEYIEFDFGKSRKLNKIDIAFHRGDARIQNLEIHVSDDSGTWKNVFTGQSSGKSLAPEGFIVNAETRFVRIIGYGNSENDWNSITEVSFIFEKDGAPAMIGGITASSSSNDGNVCANTLDANLESRWSALGNGEFVEYDLGREQDISHVEIAFYRGDTRAQMFEIHASRDGSDWFTVYQGKSSGNSLDPEAFRVDSKARFFKIVGFGNSENNWNSITEVKFRNTQIETEIASRSSSDDGNVCANTLDGSLDSRWSAQGDGEFIEYDLGTIQYVSEIEIAFHKGDSRIQKFDIMVSNDGNTWNVAFSGQSSGATLAPQSFVVGKEARFLRIIGYGNSENDWNSLTETLIHT